MDSQSRDSTVGVRRDRVIGSRSSENYWWASVLTIGSIGFLLSGLSSFYKFKKREGVTEDEGDTSKNDQITKKVYL